MSTIYIQKSIFLYLNTYLHNPILSIFKDDEGESGRKEGSEVRN